MTKYSIKFMLYRHQMNSKGLYAIYLRTTIDRKTSFKSTGHFIPEKMWDEKNEQVKSGHPDAETINAHLLLTKTEYQEKIVTTLMNGNGLSAAGLKESFKTNRTNIFEYVEDLIKRSKGKKADSTLKNYRKHLKKLEGFNKSRILSFEKIDVKFLQDYEAWLHGNIEFMKDDPHKNYVHALWKTLKTWFNAAKKEGIISHYPFDQFENPAYVSPDKDFLNVEELKMFEKFADTTSSLVYKQCAIYFLFGCYSALRISDWYRFSPEKHIRGDKIRLRPAKTKHKWVEMIISKPLRRNLLRMEKVPLTLQEPTINEKLKIIADQAGINKYLTSHTARHTFAVTICLGNKISSETTAELMGITLDTFVKNYSQVTQSKIDNETRVAWKELK